MYLILLWSVIGYSVMKVCEKLSQRNLSKPIVIQSKEKITLVNTPQVKKLRNRTSYLNWLKSDENRKLIKGLQNRAPIYYKDRLRRFHENR